MDLAKHALRLIRRAPHGDAIRDVQPDGVDFLAGEALHGLIEVILANVGDHDVHACG